MTKYKLYSVAIVKGLVEHNDKYRHFGSTMAFNHHKSEAIKEGLVTEKCELTAKGKKAYTENHWSEFSDCRAAFWVPALHHNIED